MSAAEGASQGWDRNACLGCVFVARKCGDCSLEAGRTCPAPVAGEGLAGSLVEAKSDGPEGLLRPSLGLLAGLHPFVL